jgi:hypothetical protein
MLLYSGWHDRLKQLPLHVFGGELPAKEVIGLLNDQHRMLAKWSEEEEHHAVYVVLQVEPTRAETQATPAPFALADSPVHFA